MLNTAENLGRPILYISNAYQGDSAVTDYARKILRVSEVETKMVTFTLTSRMREKCFGETEQCFKISKGRLKNNRLALATEYVTNKVLLTRTVNHFFNSRILTGPNLRVVIHSTDISIPPYTGNRMATVSIHDLIYLKNRIKDLSSKEMRFSKAFSRYLNEYRKYSHIVAASNTTKEDIILEGFNGKVTVIYPGIWPDFYPIEGVDKTELRRKLGLPIDKVLVLSVSSTDRRKNLKVVSETMAKLGKEYTLVRVGTPLRDSVTFSGISRETLNLVYNACDVLLSPSLAEGFCLPVAESLTTGLPVVASDIPIFNEVVSNAGILVEPTPDKCAVGVREAVSNESLLRKKGFFQARKFTFSEFGEKINSHHLSILNQS